MEIISFEFCLMAIYENDFGKCWLIFLKVKMNGRIENDEYSREGKASNCRRVSTTR